MTTNAGFRIQSAPKVENSAMSNRLVFSLLLVAMSIVLVWAFRPPPVIFSGHEVAPAAQQRPQPENPTE
ncbi:hypothetical protein AB4Z34_34575 [Ensifer sp. 2YAB10]|uniref:hypothetical protein n=1 Tax=unclassified Ensifer TaxID=2633371 RepID=UPI003F930E9D